MLSVVVLLCSASVSHTDCSAKTAVAVVVNRRSDSPGDCGLMAQAQMASSLQIQPGEYIKVVCRPGTPVDKAELSTR